MTFVLRAPSRISATQLLTARACRLRLVLDTSIPPVERHLPSQSPATYLGTVFHGVVEDARRGRASDPPARTRLEELWRTRLRAAETSARDAGDEDWLPFAESFDHLERMRLRALRLAESQRVRSGTGSGRGSTEAWIESADGLVVGKIDAIDCEDGLVVLRELKSGHVADEDGGALEVYRVQLMVYTALHYETTGSWPDRLELVGGRGERIDVELKPAEAVSVLNECRSIIVDLRGAVGESRTLEHPDVVSLGRTDGGACGSCRHRPICPCHIARLRAEGVVRLDSGAFPRLDVFGVADDVGERRDGHVRLVVGNASARRSISQAVVRSISDRSPLEVQIGDSVALFGAAARRSVQTDPLHEQVLPMRCTRSFKLKSTSPASPFVRSAERPASPSE